MNLKGWRGGSSSDIEPSIRRQAEQDSHRKPDQTNKGNPLMASLCPTSRSCHTLTPFLQHLLLQGSTI